MGGSDLNEKVGQFYLTINNEQMGRTPPWAKDLVLRADGYETYFYKKD